MIRHSRWHEQLAEAAGPTRSREHRRRRIRRRGRRAYIRSVYFLPALATLGNAICGFGSMYVAGLDSGGADHWTSFLYIHKFTAAAYLIFLAMLFDGIDGRLARFARHTTDFGGQLDSLADVVSFGVAPAMLSLEVLKSFPYHLMPLVTRVFWAIGAIYLSCAALRLARFNVSNKHGEQHHFSFLGLPSPGAAAAVAAFVLLQQELYNVGTPWADALAQVCLWTLPALVLAAGLLMVSQIRYPHLVNRYLRGKRSVARLMIVVVGLLVIVVAHRYALALGTMLYLLNGPCSWAMTRLRRKPAPPVHAA